MKYKKAILAMTLALTLLGCASTIFVKIPNSDGRDVDTIYKIGNESGWYVFLSRSPDRKWKIEQITTAANAYSGKYEEVLFVNSARNRIQPYFFGVDRNSNYYYKGDDDSVVTSFPCPDVTPRGAASLCNSSFLYRSERTLATEVQGGRYGVLPFSGQVIVVKMALHRPEIARAVADTDLFARLPK